MPVWNQQLQPYVRDGRLVVIGIAQEQHPERNRLFTQWQGIDWPVLYDPINLMQVRAVPIEVAIDEYGIVRGTRINRETLAQDFIDKQFSAQGVEPGAPVKVARPDIAALRDRAERARSAEAWRALGDALVLWEGTDRISDAIEAYTQAIAITPNDGDAPFRLGVCYRMRYESEHAQPLDFQDAVDHWTLARALNPNQYIWRRRVEQYGPRQTKPYPFYDWVDSAAREITARGETPIALKTLPTGSELALPDSGAASPSGDTTSPDPDGRVFRDTQPLVLAEVTVVPPRVKAGDSMRAYVTLRPNPERKAHWNNEAEPLRLWADAPAGFKIRPRLLMAAQATEPETGEPRQLEFEIQSPTEASGTFTVNTYALYYVCEDASGTCTFLRQDIPVTVSIESSENGL